MRSLFFSQYSSRRRLLSPLSRQIVVINLVTLLIPLLGFFYLADYRQKLLEVEANSLRNEARLFATAIGEGAVQQYNLGVEYLQLNPALNILNRLARNSGYRAVLFLPDGSVLADTRSLDSAIITRTLAPPRNIFAPENLLKSLLNNFHRLLNYLESATLPPIYIEPQEWNATKFPHVIKTLNGDIGQAVWHLPPNEFLISAAAPIRPMQQLFGSVMLLSKNDTVSQTIRDLRHNIIVAFCFALLFSITVSLLFARTLVRPLSQLARAAAQFDHQYGTLSALHIPIVKTPRDEIGALSRAMAAMVENLKQRISSIEGFAADVAHEIRNPIAAVQSVIETISMVQSREKQQELLHMARTELERLDCLISDILESSRIDSALLDEKRDTIDLVQETKQFVQQYCAIHATQNIILSVPDHALMISMQRNRVGQILQNLLDNARDFNTNNAPIHVTLVHENKNKQALLRIADHGAGIPHASLGKVFDRFYSDRPDDNRHRHSGLGLSIVRQIIDSHEGSIQAENQSLPNTGAVITVRLPLLG